MRFPKSLTAHTFAGALLTATCFQLVEQLLPRIPLLPWLRPGLSWIILLPFLLEFGTLPCLALFLARNLFSMAYGGVPASTFLISTSAGALAIFLFGSICRALHHKRWLGRFGASILLASAFNIAQLFFVSVFVVGSSGYFHQLGPLILWSVLSGLLVGWLSQFLSQPSDWGTLERLVPNMQSVPISQGSLVKSCWWAFVMLASLFYSHIAGLFVLTIMIWILGKHTAWRAQLATWPFWLYLAWFHLRDTPGTVIYGQWVTRQGMELFIVQMLRLLVFTGAGRMLSKHLPWQRLVNSSSTMGQGMLLCLPVLPHLFPAVVHATPIWWRHGRPQRLPGLLLQIQKSLALRVASERQ